MDPITLITTAAVAGSTLVGQKLVEKSTEHLFDRFITRLRGKANDEASIAAAFATPDDPHAVQEAVRLSNAAHDPELVEMARQLTGTLPQQQVTQIAKQIQNIQVSGDFNQNITL